MSRKVLGALATVFAVGGAAFALSPDGVTDNLAERFGGGRTADSAKGFWNSLAVAYMATIAVVSFEAGRRPETNRALLKALLTAKTISSGMFVANYLKRREGAFLASGLCDGSLAVLTAALLARSPKELQAA